jgi:hypothetical protein
MSVRKAREADMADVKAQARRELASVLRTLAKDSRDYFKLGRFKYKRKLADGTIVHFSITEPGFYKRGDKCRP